MTTTRVLALVILTVAGLSGCATTRSQDLAQSDGAAPAATQEKKVKSVSRPAASYGAMGGYRYRRLVSVNITSG